MKKLSIITLLALLLSLVPVGPVSAQTPDQPYWICNEIISGQTCPAPSAPTMNVLSNWTGVAGNGLGWLAKLEYACTPGSCNLPEMVYITIRATVTWSVTQIEPPAPMNVYFELGGQSPHQTHRYGPACGGSSCTIDMVVGFTGAQLYTGGSGVVFISLEGGGNYNDQNWTIHELSVSMISEPCNYTTVNTLADALPIDPLVETPTGAPDDQQFQTLPAYITEETLLQLTVAGGPWNDGSNDRYDTAFSWDGSTWIPLVEAISTCLNVNAETPDLRTVYLYPPAGVTEFHIRVNDTAGNFGNNTETGALTYSLATAAAPSDGKCSSQFTFTPSNGFTVTVEADNVEGEVALYQGWAGVTPEELEQPPAAEYFDWYVLVIDPATSEGWSDPDVTDSQALAVNYPGHPTFSPLDTTPEGTATVWCREVIDGIYYYYFMPPTAYGTYVVADVGLDDFANNTGSVTFTVYPAALVTRTLSDCELGYKLGDKISENTVDARQANGDYAIRGWAGFPAPPPDSGGGSMARAVGYIALDTWGSPFVDPDKGAINDFSYSADIAVKQAVRTGNETLDDLYAALDITTVTYQPQPTADAVMCAVMLDPYHWRTYISLGAHNDSLLLIRAADGANDWEDNSGALSYRVWEATSYDAHEPGTPPGIPGSCASLFTVGDLNGSIYIDATNAAGEIIPTIPEYFYAIETTDGPWQLNGVGDDLYSVQFPTAAGEFVSLQDSDAVLCSEEVAEGSPYVRFYVRGNAGTTYSMRVDDDVHNSMGGWLANTGSMGANIYSLETNSDPWENCADSFPDLSSIPAVGDFVIPANNALGLQLPALVPGYTYAVAIVGGVWLDLPDPTQRRDIQISKDNAATWTPQDSFVTSCAQIRDDYLRFYFTYTEGNVWRLRVNEESLTSEVDLDWLGNGGELTVRLYSTNQETGLPGSDGGMYCNELGCQRPTSILDVGAWIEYARCSLQRYLAWCPRHTAALIATTSIGRHYEPWATMIGMIDIFDYVRDEFRAYVWTKNDPLDPLSQNGGQARGAANDLVPNARSTPWGGGKIVFGNAGEYSAATLTCASAFSTIIGSGGNAYKSFCWTASVLKIMNKQWPFLNIVITFGAIVFFIVYLSRAWINQGQK